MNGRQLLSDFIAKNTTQAQFARDIGCKDSHLSLVLDGKRGVSFRLARKIAEVTGGAVPLESLPAARQAVDEAAE